VCMVILIGDMSRGIFFPSMWPLVESLGGSAVTLGYAVAAFSFGRILVNPLFGSWSHTYGYTKTLLIACSVLFLGTLLYAAVPHVGRPEFLIVAQTVLGIGSGTLGVTRAFVADVTAQRQRTQYMAWITAVQYGGFTCTPIVGAAFNYFFRNTNAKKSPIFNMFTAPAYFMATVVLITIVILLLYFQDRQRIETEKGVSGSATDGPPKKKSRRRQEIDRVANSIPVSFIPLLNTLTMYDWCIVGCMLLNISTKGSIAAFETMGIAVAESHFSLASSRAGLTVGLCGALGVISLLSMTHLTTLCSDVTLMMGGMALMSASVALFTSLNENANVVLHNPTWKYNAAIFLMYAVGYPIGHTAVIGLFSKSTCVQCILYYSCVSCL